MPSHNVPSITSQRRRAWSYLNEFVINDFSGGLNTRDAPSQLADNETPDCMNISINERGGLEKRLGYVALNTGFANAPTNLFYSKTLSTFLVQDGTALKKTPDYVAVTTIHTFTTSARVGMCDFGGKLVVVHPIDGLFTYDGTTFSAVVTGPKGFACVAWQGKVHVIGDPANPTRLWASGVQDPTDWNEAGTGGAYHNDIREGPYSDMPLTALGAGQGMDISGRPGLLVYKERSLHRVYQSSGTTAGAYTTLSIEAGAAGPLAVTTVLGRTVSISPYGIYETDGVKAPILVSARIANLFTPEQINFSQMANFAAGSYTDRVFFSIPWGAAQTTNNRTLEYSPIVGWIMPHDFGASCFTTSTKNTEQLQGGSPTAGKVFHLFSGWSDDGAAITSRYQTRWFAPTGDNTIRVRRVRVSGRGIFSLYFKKDFQVSDGVLNAVSLTSSAAVWGTSTWGVGVWGPGGYEFYADFHSIGLGNSIAFMFKESSVVSATGPNLLEDGAAPQLGAFAVYSLQVQFVPLGVS